MFHDSVFFEMIPMRTTTPFTQSNISSYGVTAPNSYYSASNILGYNNRNLTSMATGAALGAAAMSMAQSHNNNNYQMNNSYSGGFGDQMASSVNNVMNGVNNAMNGQMNNGFNNGMNNQMNRSTNNNMNAQMSSGVVPPQTMSAGPATPPMQIPNLLKKIQKGQKVPLQLQPNTKSIKVNFGWNTTNPKCDIDVSAFLLGENGKVLGDDWFVFYGQPNSPDQSVTFSNAATEDRQFMNIDFSKLNPNVKKIVFVLTINEAYENRLNFSMLKDAYARVMDNNNELVSFQMTEYYSNVISMMIGEVYLHNGNWKFNAVGNGVDRDLSGLCELYGVQVID